MLNHFCYFLIDQLKLLSFLSSQQIPAPLYDRDTSYLTSYEEYHDSFEADNFLMSVIGHQDF